MHDSGRPVFYGYKQIMLIQPCQKYNLGYMLSENICICVIFTQIKKTGWKEIHFQRTCTFKLGYV